MATRLDVPRRAPVIVGLIDFVLFLQIFLLCLFYSQSYNFFEQYRSALFQTIFAIDVLFIVVALPFTPIVALSSASIICLALFYQLVFTINYHTAFTGAFVGSFPGLYVAGLFAVHARRRSLPRALSILYLACLAYLFVFLYLRLTIDPYMIMKQQMLGGQGVSKAVMRAHGSATASSGQTEYRIKVAGPALAFAFFYPFSMFRWRASFFIRLGWAVASAFGAYCLIVADSRFNLACVAVAVVIQLVPVISSVAKAASSLIFSLVCALGSAIIAFTGMNPFLIFAADESGAFRAQEYVVAMQQLLRFPLFGVGLPGQIEDYGAAFGGAPVFPSDLGYFGELLQHGLLGIVLLVLSHCLIFVFIKRAARSLGVSPNVRFLSACFIFTTLNEVITTNLWEGASSILLSLAIAYVTLLRDPAGTAETAPDATMSEA